MEKEVEKIENKILNQNPYIRIGFAIMSQEEGVLNLIPFKLEMKRMYREERL